MQYLRLKLQLSARMSLLLLCLQPGHLRNVAAVHLLSLGLLLQGAGVFGHDRQQCGHGRADQVFSKVVGTRGLKRACVHACKSLATWSGGHTCAGGRLKVLLTKHQQQCRFLWLPCPDRHGASCDSLAYQLECCGLPQLLANTPGISPRGLQTACSGLLTSKSH